MTADIVSLSICFLISFMLSNAGSYMLSGILLCAEGLFLCIRNLKKGKVFPDPVSIFSLSWIFCIGISALKLSNLQTRWETMTWVCFYLIYLCFYVICRLAEKKLDTVGEALIKCGISYDADVFPVIIALTVISVACFLYEAGVLGFIPLFTTDTPHAYSYFHISGVHYFTVLFVLEPSFFVYYLLKCTRSRSRDLISSLCTLICLILPILLVSRFQLLFGIILASFTFALIRGKEIIHCFSGKNLLIVLAGVILLISCYVFITVERAHSVEYLNGIFEMKDPNMPIFITQPYMYVANNFDNFNCMVKDLPKHTFGLKQLFPVLALTGLKFRFPELVNFPLYVTKEELTTVTMFYDAYYDFGLIGCMLMSSVLGAVYALTCHLMQKIRTPGASVIPAQLFSYLFLAFFTTWFSNPTTWFYLLICVAIEALLWYFYSYKKKKGSISND